MRTEDPIAGRRRPFTGAEFLASLRDGREVYLDGERVRDVTSHPGMRNAARSVARLYDALHDPASGGEVVCATDTGSGGFTHRYFRVPRCREDLVGAQKAIAAWARLGYGWLGRSPDYKASLTNTLGANPEFYGPYAGNARRWYARAQEAVPFMNHSVVNPPIDRHRPVSELKDVFVRVERETDAGIVVSGAKVVATAAALTHFNFVGQTPLTACDDPEMAVSFIVPIASAGLKLFCRASYELAAARAGSPFDYPLSSRFDENDAILVLDKVLVPWEDVLIYRDPARVKAFFPESGFVPGFLFHGCTRLAVKLDFLGGLLAKALKATGGGEARGNRALLGEVIAMAQAVWSLSNAMAYKPDPWVGDAVLPSREAATAYCVLAPDLYPRVRDIVQKTVGSALVYLPSSVKDLLSPAVDPFLRRYVRGAGTIGHAERIKVLKLLWDAVGTEFAGRHELYERSYAGSWEGLRLMVAGDAERTGRARRMEELVDRCLAEYDEGGWTAQAWSEPRAAA